jgi:hypothetical protein
MLKRFIITTQSPTMQSILQFPRFTQVTQANQATQPFIRMAPQSPPHPQPRKPRPKSHRSRHLRRHGSPRLLHPEEFPQSPPPFPHHPPCPMERIPPRRSRLRNPVPSPIRGSSPPLLLKPPEDSLAGSLAAVAPAIPILI